MKLGKIAAVAVVSISMVAVTACESGGPKETIGTLGGAALGGLAGSQIGSGRGQLLAVGAGVLLGAFAGREIGKSLDKADKLEAERTANTALEYNKSGETSTWSNPDSGHQGTVTPTQTTYTDSGQPCREFQQTVTIGGKTEQAYGTACRQEDGSWKIVQ